RGNAHMLCAKREQSVFYRILAQNDDRLLDRKAKIQQRLTDAPHLIQCFAIGGLAPFARCGALRHPWAIRRDLGPMDQSFVDLVWISAELILAPDQNRAVGSRFPIELGRPKPHIVVSVFDHVSSHWTTSETSSGYSR